MGRSAFPFSFGIEVAAGRRLATRGGWFVPRPFAVMMWTSAKERSDAERKAERVKQSGVQPSGGRSGAVFWLRGDMHCLMVS